MNGYINVTRGNTVESVHRVHVAVVGAQGELVACVGDAQRTGFLRSAAKPWQALPLVEDGVADAFGFTEAELALCCASHNTEPGHLAGARSILAKIGLDEGALECGPHFPISESVTRELLSGGVTFGPIHNNCSGKHAGMLALAIHHGWTPAGYLAADHPVQRRMAEEVVRWTGLKAEEIPTAVDGCGVPTYSVPMSGLAQGFARFAAHGGGPARVVRAMTREPFMIAGTGRLCTDLMSIAGGTLYCKTGAEGVYAAAAVDGRYGVGIKVEDGARRASEAALLRVLAELEMIDEVQIERLSDYIRAPVRDTLGDMVGEVRPEFELEWI